jgi:hypothetical protein
VERPWDPPESLDPPEPKPIEEGPREGGERGNGCPFRISQGLLVIGAAVAVVKWLRR